MTRSEQMVKDPVLFHAIHLDMPVDAVYRRLGYRKALTRVSREQRREVEAALQDAARFIELKGSALILPVEVRHGDT
ncbi:MAG TPA: hypothetical protein PKW48_12160, partial [Deltaproteobacteria bacterium]|nr:hypothetical protein [Deltaproteobacteria bacterium]